MKIPVTLSVLGSMGVSALLFNVSQGYIDEITIPTPTITPTIKKIVEVTPEPIVVEEETVKAPTVTSSRPNTSEQPEQHDGTSGASSDEEHEDDDEEEEDEDDD